MKKIYILLFAAFSILTLKAQISLTATCTPYTQDFNSLAISGTSSTLPVGWLFTETLANANTTYTASTGSGTAGDTYSFGASASTERAFGCLQSGSLTATYGFWFTNNTGTTITSLTIAYKGETWRVGASNRTDGLNFSYNQNAASITATTGTWTNFSALDYFNPGQATGNGSMLHSANISSTIIGLTITNGTSFCIRWSDFNASGSDDGLGIDDFSLIAYSGSTWTGATDTDWNKASNWCGGIPTSTTNVVIPSAPANQPTIASASPAAMANNLTINMGATLTNATGGLLEISGALTNNGTFTSTTGNVSFLGIATQTPPALTVNNLLVNNAAGVTPTGAITVNGALTLTNGILTTTATNLLTLADAATSTAAIATSFVNGPVKKTGNDNFIFPIGKTGTPNRIGECGINNTLGTVTDEFTAEYFPTPYSSLTVSGALSAIDSSEYWDIQRTVGGSTPDVTLYWKDGVFSGIPGTISAANITVCHFNSMSTFWEDEFYGTHLGDRLTGGSVTTNAVSNFSPFTIGLVSGTLPIAVNTFNATKQNSNTNALNWKATCTGASVNFELQRSTNGIIFTPINTITATQARCAAPFNYVDNYNATSPITYYKLKVISNTGEVKFSQIVAINNKNANANTLALYPNITKGNAVLVVESKTIANANFVITDAKGAIIHRFTENLSEGANAYPINVTKLSAGNYQISGIINGTLKTIRFIKE